jgi:hypothetical protein
VIGALLESLSVRVLAQPEGTRPKSLQAPRSETPEIDPRGIQIDQRSVHARGGTALPGRFQGLTQRDQRECVEWFGVAPSERQAFGLTRVAFHDEPHHLGEAPRIRFDELL